MGDWLPGLVAYFALAAALYVYLVVRVEIELTKPRPSGDARLDAYAATLRPLCDYDPTPLVGTPMGMFHCPECGCMILAGVQHPPCDPDMCGKGTNHPEIRDTDKGKLRWHYGPTATDPEPGQMWCYDCGSLVYGIEDGYICSGCARWGED